MIPLAVVLCLLLGRILAQSFERPTINLSRKPRTRRPMYIPTPQPSNIPTQHPTTAPTRQPTDIPTQHPTTAPTRQPTDIPTQHPTTAPTRQPTDIPTQHPTTAPTRQPTDIPTQQPTTAPTRQPTDIPTQQPTTVPTPLQTNPPIVPTVLPTTSAQLSPTTSVTGQCTTPTTTSLSTDSGLYSSDFSFRRLSAGVEDEFNYFDFTRFNRVTGAPVVDYVDIGIAPSGTTWVAIAKGGATYISADAGLTWSQCITVAGATKVIFNAIGEVIFLNLPLTYNGTITSGVDIVRLDYLLHICVPPPSTTPTPTPSPLCTGSCCSNCGVYKGSRISTATSTSTMISYNSTSITETTCLA